MDMVELSFMESLNKEQDVINEEPVSISMRNDDGSITTTIKEVTDLNEQETALYEFGQKVETLMEKIVLLILLSGVTTKDKLKRNLMFTHRHMPMVGLLNSIKVLEEVGKNVNKRKI